MMIGEFIAGIAKCDPLDVAHYVAKQINRYIALELNHIEDVELRLEAFFNQVECDTGRQRRRKLKNRTIRKTERRHFAGQEAITLSRPNTSRRDNWITRRGSPDFAMIVYFWFSFISADRSYSDAIDKALRLDNLKQRTAGLSVEPWLWLPQSQPESARNSNWLNPILIDSLPFLGRGDELAKLNAFVGDEAPFLMWAISGPSGAGKTRLVIEWLRRLQSVTSEPAWNAGFFTADSRAAWLASGASWEQWKPERPTVLVIDYIHEFARDVIALFRRFARGPRSPVPRVRLLIIDRIVPDSFDEIVRDPRLSGLSTFGIDIEDKRQFFYSGRTLSLGADAQSAILLGEIMASAAKHFGGHLEPGQIARGLERLKKLAGGWYPLFSALIGREIAFGSKHIAKNRRHLIELYLDTTNRLPWRSADADLAQLGSRAAFFVSASTALQGASLASLLFFETNGDSKDCERQRLMISIVSVILSSRIAKDVPALRPDIIGETFFLLFLELIQYNLSTRLSFYEYLGLACDSHGANALLQFCGGMVDNLILDDQNDPSISHYWDVLIDFFENVPKTSQASPLLATAIALIFERLNRHGQNNPRLQSIRMRCLNALDLNEIAEAASGPAAIKTMMVYTALYEQLDISLSENPNYFTTLIDIMTRVHKYEPLLLPLVSAAELGHRIVLQDLLRTGHWKCNESDRNGITPLIAAVEAGNVAIVRDLVAYRDVDVNYQRLDGATALVLACQAGNIEIASALLTHIDINPNLVSEAGISPLFAASKHGSVEIVAMLLSHPEIAPNIATSAGTTPLMRAIVANQLEIVDLLLKHPETRVRSQNDISMTALAYAVLRGNSEMIKKLCLDERTDILERGENGVTALHIACLKNRTEAVSFIIDRDRRSLGVRDDSGATPLMFAALLETTECLEILLTSTQLRDLQMRDNEGATARDYAMGAGNIAAITLVDRLANHGTAILRSDDE